MMDSLWVRLEPGDLRTSVLDAMHATGIEFTQRQPTGRRGPTVIVEHAPEYLVSVEESARRFAGIWRLTPALVLVADVPLSYSRAEAILAGAEDLIAWPQQQDEFTARVRSLLRRRNWDIDLHPLTALPGGAALHEALAEALADRGNLAVLACDLREFKAFNDRYGFARGDKVLRFVADLLERVAADEGVVYHIGGDDFFVITRPSGADELARQSAGTFRAQVRQFYDAEDLDAGFITGLDRGTGQRLHFPVMQLTIACATNEADDIEHVGQLIRTLAELKEYAKSTAPDGYARDRRRVHDVAESLRRRSRREGE